MERIHVLHVLNSAHGGSALSTFQLIQMLSLNHIKSSLICFNNANAAQQQKINDLVDGRVLFVPLRWTNKRIRTAQWKRPVLEILSLIQTWGGYRYQKQIAAMIQQHGINIIHTSTILNPEGAIAAMRNNLPHIWHVRELVGRGTYYQFSNYKKWISFVKSHSKVLVANSTVTRNNLLQYFDESQVKCISNGIDLKGYEVKVHVNQGTPLIIGMVGNVTSRLKNHEFFIHAAAAFSNDPKFEFRIYGALPDNSDGYFNHLLRLIKEKKLDHKCKFMGHKENPAEIMKEIDILFHPTGLESFGRIFIEAMAGGIPIIAVEQGGAVELVRPGINGYLIKENDHKVAAVLLKKLADSDIRNVFGRNGRAIVEESYTLEQAVDRILSLYKVVLSNCSVG